MPRTRRFWHKKEDDNDDEFEAFRDLNEPKSETKDDSDSDAELAESDEPSDDEDANLLDDDDAPEDVGFAASKKSVLSQFKEALHQIDAQKQKKKEKRKLTAEQFKQQKEKKLEEIFKARLPDDFLEELDDEVPPKKQKKSKKETRAPETSDPESGIDSDAVAEELALMGEDSEDYISLTSDKAHKRPATVSVVRLGEEEKAVKTLAQSAADFRRNRLYGSNIRRESVKDKAAKAMKRKARFR